MKKSTRAVVNERLNGNPDSLQEWAKYYASIGWSVFPVYSIRDGVCSCEKKACGSPGKHPLTKNGFKDATRDVNIIKSWWNKWPTANIGIVTGKISGIVVLDIDLDKGGETSLKKIVANNELPETILSITGGGGRHIFFKHPGDRLIKNATGLQGYSGIDFRADGGYVVAPPSLHLSGKRYEFEDLKSPKHVEPAILPHWLNELLISGSNIQRASNSITATTNVIHKGKRNDTLARAAGSLRRIGLDQQGINSALLEINKKQCKPPLPSTEVDQISKSIAKYPPAIEVDQPHLTDLGNSEMMAALYGEDLKFCPSWKKWFVWDGTKWAFDEKRKIWQKAKQTIKQMYRLGMEIRDHDKRSAFMIHIAKTEAINKLRAMIDLASSHSDIAIGPDELDNDPWLLNAANGVIDLQTKELRSHDKRNLTTKIIPVLFDEQAQCNRWLQFLDEVIGDKAVIDFIQLAIGWSLTGIQKDHKFFILHGSGANGKSTFLNTILALLGDYGIQTPTETLLIKQGGSGIPNDIARLKGARFVSAVEAPEGKRLNETLIKQLTGGDPITARFMHAEFFTFYPEFKLWLGTNHKPVIRETTHAIWRRICLIPFTKEIPSDMQDKELQEKLRSELPGILNWALEGCLMWQRNGFPISPETIATATAVYRTEMDIFSNFLDECCQFDRRTKTRSSDLHGAYSRWCDEMGEKALSQRWFSFRLEERGFKKDITRQGRFWFGIKLKRCDA